MSGEPFRANSPRGLGSLSSGLGFRVVGEGRTALGEMGLWNCMGEV